VSRSCARAASLADDPSGGPARPDHRLSLLIVDDDDRVLRGLLETVAQEHDLWVVGTARDAVAARRLARSAGPAVVLIDVLLPDRTVGLGLVSELTEAGWPVVAMSIQSGVRRSALGAGAMAFVDKGDGVDAILDAVREAGRSAG
jgi:two-component system invasion response regulator UvrY